MTPVCLLDQVDGRTICGLSAEAIARNGIATTSDYCAVSCFACRVVLDGDDVAPLPGLPRLERHQLDVDSEEVAHALTSAAGPGLRPARLCACGCGEPVEQQPRLGWTPAKGGRPQLYVSPAHRTRRWRATARQDAAAAKLPPVLLSSASVEWYTPTDVFDEYADRWGPFNLDPASHPLSPIWSRIPVSWSQADDGLSRPWFGRVWLNPPYGRALATWLRYAAGEVAAGRAELVAALVPARTDTRWWWEAEAAGAVPYFRRGRIAFVLPTGKRASSATFPSALLVFSRRPPAEEPPR